MSEITHNQTINDRQTKEMADTAPHLVINWVATHETNNTGIGQCSVCKTEGMKLVEVSRISLASTFRIECETCKQKKEKLRIHIFISNASIKTK